VITTVQIPESLRFQAAVEAAKYGVDIDDYADYSDLIGSPDKCHLVVAKLGLRVLEVSNQKEMTPYTSEGNYAKASMK
jgi:hypothetical protein